MEYWKGKRAIITGGSAGLGRALADVLVQHGARVAIVARHQPALDNAARELQARGGTVLAIAADVTLPDEVKRLADEVQSTWGGIDLLCACAGRSMRGTVLTTPPDEFRALWETNFVSALLCVQSLAPALQHSRGHVALIGSLASKLAAGYLGAYPTSKFPLAALAQQLRIENGDDGFHTLLVCPGPIARTGAADSTRYTSQSPDVPAEAHQPGGGAKVRAIDPLWLADKILRSCELRRAELIVPKRAQLLFAAAQLSPTLGDWLLRRMTTG
jgi:uncharacterized protein